MKKIIMLMSLAFLVVAGFAAVPASASVTTKATLRSGDYSADSPSIYFSKYDDMDISVSNYWYSDHDIVWTVYKEGFGGIFSGRLNPNESTTFTFTQLENYGSGQYFIRLNCDAYEAKTGCEAAGFLTNK